jgi:hypothetical protein
LLKPLYQTILIACLLGTAHQAVAQQPSLPAFFARKPHPTNPFYDRYFLKQQRDSTFGKPVISPKQVDAMQWLVGEWTISSKGFTKTTVRKDGKRTFEWQERAVEFLLGEDRSLFLARKDSLVLSGREGNEKRPYPPQLFLKYDPFTQVWVLVGGYDWGAMVSGGWQGKQMVFTGRIMLAGLEIEERQTWIKRSEQELCIRYQEQLRDGQWFLSEENIYRKVVASDPKSK